MSMTMDECKKIMIDISNNEDVKASIVSEMLATVHKYICGKNSNSLTLTLKDLALVSSKTVPITQTDFKVFAEDVLIALHSENEINLAKYNYIPWFLYISNGFNVTGDLNALKGCTLNLPNNLASTNRPSDELHSLLKQTGLKNTVLVYGILLFITRS